MFTEDMTLIKYYYNPYHISSRIEENKINLASWMHELHSNPITLQVGSMNHTQTQSHYISNEKQSTKHNIQSHHISDKM